MREIRIGSVYGAGLSAIVACAPAVIVGALTLGAGCTGGKGESGADSGADSLSGDSAADSRGDSDSGAGGDSGADTGDTGIPARGAWTLLVYMVGDNDLESAVQHDLNELERGWPDQGVQAIVLADRAEGYADDGGDWTGTRLYRIGGDESAEVRSELVEDWGERDMADPATLEEFLLWAADHAPAERYALALWDHGTGWYLTGDQAGEAGAGSEESQQQAQGAPPPGIGWDESSGAELSIASGALAEGLEAFVAREGRFEVVAFDACNMAYFEVGYALAPYAEHMVAAQTTVGMEGLQYDLALAALTADPGMGGAELAVEMAAAPVEVAGEWTFSAMDLDALGGVREALDAVADRAMGEAAAGAALLAARGAARGAEPGERYRLSYMDLADLAAQAEVAGADEAARGEALALQAAVGAAVIGDFSQPGFAWTGGMNVYADTLWLGMYHAGPGATWARDGRWDEALLWIEAQP